MPRPNPPIRAGRTSRKFNNPPSRWLKEQSAKKKALEEQAVRMFSDKIADNALKLIDELNSVDFIHSGLPESILTNYAEGPYAICQIAWDTRALLIQLFKNDRQNINMDIRRIDEKLMTLVLMFKQFVARGDVMAAQMSLDALQVCIQEIRCKLPVYQPNLSEAFVRENTAYLDKWITLVCLAQIYDHARGYLEDSSKAVQMAEAIWKTQREAFRQRTKVDPLFAEAFCHVLFHNSPADRNNWTLFQHEVYRLMVDARYASFAADLHRLQRNTVENELRVVRPQLESLRTFLNHLPNVSDPILMNQYWDAMDKFLHSIHEIHVHMDATLHTVEQQSNALDQLIEFEGAFLQMEIALNALAKSLNKSLYTSLDHPFSETVPAFFYDLVIHGWLTLEERDDSNIPPSESPFGAFIPEF